MDNRSGDNAEHDGGQAASDLNPEASRGSDPVGAERPSQAEGDRETITEDIEQKERDGDL